MTATETWLLVAAVAAGVGALLHLLPPPGGRPWPIGAIASALVAVSVGCVAIALAVSPL